MKKIIKSSLLLFGICFIAGKATAQLASDAPALTPAKVAEIQKKQATDIKTTATEQTASSKASTPVKIASVKPVEQAVAPTKVAAPAKVPTISNQAVPAIKVTEVKVPPVTNPKPGGK